MAPHILVLKLITSICNALVRFPSAFITSVAGDCLHHLSLPAIVKEISDLTDVVSQAALEQAKHKLSAFWYTVASSFLAWVNSAVVNSIIIATSTLFLSTVER